MNFRSYLARTTGVPTCSMPDSGRNVRAVASLLIGWHRRFGNLLSHTQQRCVMGWVRSLSSRADKLTPLANPAPGGPLRHLACSVVSTTSTNSFKSRVNIPTNPSPKFVLFLCSSLSLRTRRRRGSFFRSSAPMLVQNVPQVFTPQSYVSGRSGALWLHSRARVAMRLHFSSCSGRSSSPFRASVWR